MAWEYTDKTKQLFMDAMAKKPGTHLGKIENADAVGVDGSIVCGDSMTFYFNVEKDEKNPLNDRITEVKYETFGCTSAIASSEALCQILVSKKYTPIEALKIKNKDIVEVLGGLPQQKIHCSVMGAKAIEQAIKDWANKRGVDISKYLKEIGEDEHEDEGRVVCECYSLTEPFLKRKIKELNLKTLEEVMNATKAGGSCGNCQERPGGIRDILNEVWGNQEVQAQEEDAISPPSCNFQEQIEKVTQEKIRPALKLHGGDITIVEIKDNKVYCTLQGACSDCSGAKFTLKNIVEKHYKEFVDESIVVIDV